MKIHPSLVVHFNQNPQAEIRHDGEQLFWENDGRQNSITWFPSKCGPKKMSLREAKKMAGFANDITFSGNLRFSSTL